MNTTFNDLKIANIVNKEYKLYNINDIDLQ